MHNKSEFSKTFQHSMNEFGVGSIFSLTVITLTVCVIYTTVFEYKNQVMFNMTVFDGGPRCQIDTCF